MDNITKYLNRIAYKFPKGYPDMNNAQDVLLLEAFISEVIGEKFSLKETPLTPKELQKTNSKTGESRIDILIGKIQKGEELELDAGGTFTVDNKDEAIKALKSEIPRSGVILIDSEGNQVSTSKLKKSTEFGGGKGSGGGAAQTDQQESAQSLVNALSQKLGNDISVEDLTPENLKSIAGKVDITSPISDTIDFITNSPNWSDTLIHTAKLVNDFIGQDVEFHRGSSFVDSIYSSWNQARKADKLGGIKNDKWNPSDIWAVSPDVKSIEFKTDLAELNNQLIDLFDERKLVGISLKKLGPDSKITVRAKEPQVEKDGYVEATISPTSKDAYINFTSGAKMQLRTFSNDGTSFQGELKGKTANQGKIGGGVLRSILSRNGLDLIPTQKESLTKATDLSNNFIKEFIELSKKYGKFNITEEELKSKTVDWISSKYQALSVIKAIEDGSKENVEDALTDIRNYAGSTSSISSVHLKVS
tara:strand:- start:152 stop:1576 length:1425 start_codon:yes stop_codon:yes gene_type:complete